MLTVDEARAVAAVFRPRFSTEEAFTRSWDRYMATTRTNSRRNRAELEQWLQTDLGDDAVAAVGLAVPESLLPVRQDFTLGDESDCSTCLGKRYVKRLVPITDPNFGRIEPCPQCGTGSPQEAA